MLVACRHTQRKIVPVFRKPEILIFAERSSGSVRLFHFGGGGFWLGSSYSECLRDYFCYPQACFVDRERRDDFYVPEEAGEFHVGRPRLTRKLHGVLGLPCYCGFGVGVKDVSAVSRSPLAMISPWAR